MLCFLCCLTSCDVMRCHVDHVPFKYVKKFDITSDAKRCVALGCDVTRLCCDVVCCEVMLCGSNGRVLR